VVAARRETIKHNGGMRRSLIVLSFVTSLVGPVAAAGAATPGVTVPPDAWVTIDGHGFGHGHGLSQYGAEGAARKGLTAQRIVDFYYPGTGHGRAGGSVKVKITADDDNNTVVMARSGLVARDYRAGTSWTLPTNLGATRWRFSVAAGNATALTYLASGAWHRWKTLKGDGAFTAGSQPVTLVTPDGQVAYRGTLQSRRPSSASTNRITVNVLSLENYLRGVVPREIPASWSPAAVRAQAIAARTYAAYERAHPASSVYQICDTASCQVYGGYSAEHPDSDAAISATAGKIQTYDGGPAFTQFSASDGGWNSAGSQPYLVAQQDPYDGWSGNPYHSWTVRVDATKIEQAWSALGDLQGITVTSRDGNGEWGGRVLTLVLSGRDNDVPVSGDTFRSLLGLRSNWLHFTATAK